MRISSISYKTNYILFVKKKVMLWCFFLFISQFGYAQTYTLPDTSLRNKLQTSYPAVMTAGQLNIAAAGALTGMLDLSSAGITNADGIQYFTNLSFLNLNNNQLVTLPSLAGLTQLIGIYVAYNKLTSFPSISAQPNLSDFQVQYNNLTSLPDFSSNVNLLYIYCQNNKITSLPDVSMLSNLLVLDIGSNPFGTLPDLSPLTNLEQLHVHRTGIDTIIGLGALTNLQKLYAWGNNIRNLSSLNNITTLTLLQVFNNKLTDLPVLSNKPSLTVVSLSDNYLTFEDILPLTSLANFSSYGYSPQRIFPLPIYSIREKDSISFSLQIDQSLSTNLYTWYKNGNILTTNQTGILVIEEAAYADSGDYSVEVTNPALPGFTVYSNTSHLAVGKCLEIKNMGIEIISEDCKDGSLIQIVNLTMGGGIAPFAYGISKKGKPDTLFFSTPQFQSIAPGLYEIILQDSRMCTASKSVSIKKPTGCQALISPNGDGIMDSYFIEEAGIARIYDAGRNLIKELATPSIWDGSKSDQGLAEDGYYAIVINDKKVIHITLVK